MKKFYYMAALLALSSCHNDSLNKVENSDNNNPNDRQEIRLGARQRLDVDVKKHRGIGGIGNVADPVQLWNGQSVFVYGVDTRSTATGTTAVLINAQEAKTPVGQSSDFLSWSAPETHFYYDRNGVYQFYGMFIDDAASAAAPYQVPVGTAYETLQSDGLSFPVTIDGSQDLMIAATDPEADAAGTEVDLSAKPDDLKFIYSAWSARRGVVPNLTFKHVLTRLFFKASQAEDIKPGNEVYIDQIVIKDAQNKGVLTVIPSATTQQGLVADAAAEGTTVTGDLFLKQLEGNNMISLEPVAVDSKDTPKSIGESLLLFPTTDAGYKVEFHTHQDVDADGVISDFEKAVIPSTVRVQDPEGNYVPFEAGKYYTITLKVYNMQEIKVKATLTGWQDGGDSNVDTDEPF